MEQLKLFKEDKKVLTKKDVEEIKEKNRLANLCFVCKENKSSYGNKCESCIEKYYLSEFDKYGFGQKGFKDEGKFILFYSQTTGKEETEKDRILKIHYNIMGDSIFLYCIQICDEFGSHKNTLGISEEFGEYLKKELNLKEQLNGTKDQIEFNGEDFHKEWINPKINQDEKGKKKSELEKEIQKQKTELTEKIVKLKNI